MEAKASSRWLTMENFIACAKTQKICGYVSLRGRAEGRICGAPAVFVHDDPINNRCKQCAIKVKIKMPAE
jgi:hypothetical protein